MTVGGVMTAAELEALFMSPPPPSSAQQQELPVKLSKDKEWQLAFMTEDSNPGRPIYGRHNGSNRMTTVAELEANIRKSSPPPPLPLPPTAPQQDMAAFNKLLGLMQVKAAQQQQQQHIQQQLQQQVGMAHG